ncbi:MAG: PBSX family phage terminase large subunit, partial [Oscillospiraceae bacterium]
MTFEKLSGKQRELLTWAFQRGEEYRGVICDGAVRSGKTVCMVTAFVLWAMRYFDGASFGITGKTVRSAERNIVMPLENVGDITAYFNLRYNRSLNRLTVQGGGKENYFYIFGGRDESSFMLIQGITLAGVLFDEVALMPRSFVEQAIARTLSVEGSKLWFNCNPESPAHWFREEWILKAEEKRVLHLHFLMSDNPILTKSAIEDGERLYSGVFYDRYIKGLWVVAEGLIYTG